MKLRSLILLAAALGTTAALAQSAVYKWVDKNGNVHYSSVPPNSTLAPTAIVNTADTLAVAAGSAPSAASAVAALTTIKGDDSPACKTARETLAKYMSASYLYTLGKDGKQQKLDAEQQAAAVAQARNAVTQTCTSQASPP
ncbi:MAG: DUF4124 domain-containing protein [Gammaproteobacteria bacterium]|nr:DUF4124 domain-containing protein [Gammaproteobacteria bacterium]MDE2023601.1 DUF4124 domain-containing protein [Gammaproteobacteria bacterium]MDE2139090.1 DUF4124 domain-containing protein [Gammaproteobacteria bacterium]MDE2273917.1 DUF4124 domain-containing protein [Gammaproteobacteria bacterium]